MTSHVSFAGSIPDLYDRYMGPTFMEPYARDLASRQSVPAGGRLLEIACGTGRLTRQLVANLPDGATIDATDLNEAMIDVARDRVRSSRVRWATSDVAALAFDDATFDEAFCQFGSMFFPDKVAAAREVRRVLKRGAAFWLNVWAALAENPVSRIANETAAQFFDGDAPPFFRVPFGYNDCDEIARDLRAGGFSRVDIDLVDIEGVSSTAREVAIGLVQGTPMANEIRERGRVPADVVTDAVAAALAREFGAAPVRAPMRALVVRAS